MEIMEIEAALKRPEFDWLRKKIGEIDEVLRAVPEGETPKDKRANRAKKITTITTYIKSYVEEYKPWKAMEKPKLIANINSINNYVYTKVWEKWEDDELREKDQKAHSHIQLISSVTGPKNFGLPEGVETNPLFEAAVNDIKTLDAGASPIKKLTAIQEAYNKFASKKIEIQRHTHFHTDYIHIPGFLSSD